jgi:serine/threonine-protein kinase
MLVVLPAGNEVESTGETYCVLCTRSFGPDDQACPFDGSTLVRIGAQVDPMLGRVLDDRYQIVSQLGRGGMGAVYRARQLSVDREVAIKVVHPSFASDPEVARRFLREARVASSLSAPGIVSIFDFGQTTDGVLYLVMELIVGRTLAEELRERGPIVGVHRVLEVARQVVDALDVAHTAGITHRDLKPSNIIEHVTPTGPVIKVLDFGIAKLEGRHSVTTKAGLAGTPFYMAPEQFESRSDHRSDLYSLGCILYEIATGSPPFVDKDLTALYVKILTTEPAPLPGSIPRPLVEVIRRLLAKDPADRFATSADVRNALMAVPMKPGSAPIIRTMLTPVPRLSTDTLHAAAEAGLVPAAHVPAEPVLPPAVTPNPRRDNTLVLVLGLAALVVATAVAVVLLAF